MFLSQQNKRDCLIPADLFSTLMMDFLNKGSSITMTGFPKRTDIPACHEVVSPEKNFHRLEENHKLSRRNEIHKALPASCITACEQVLEDS